MATNITSLKFDDGENIVVRLITNSSPALYDLEATAIEFQDNGVMLEYANTETTTARVFVPYTSIQQVYQEL